MKKLILIWLSLLFIVLSACGAPDDADVIEKSYDGLRAVCGIEPAEWHIN